MPHWIIKSALQRFISWLPRSQFWNGQLQKWVTKSTILNKDSLRGKLLESACMLAIVRQNIESNQSFTAFEIGTGWSPVIPVALHLCGAGNIWTTDIDPLLNKSRVQRLLRLLVELEAAGELRTLLPEAQPDRISSLAKLATLADQEEPAQLLKKIGIHVLSCDARKTPMPNESIDLFFSSGVLEYIPQSVLEEILQESRRIASVNFVSIHRLNLVDQFSYFDKNITPFHFLKFSPRQWDWVNSPLIWQNRLRIADYREIFEKQGFEIVSESNVRGNPAELERVKLAPEFQNYAKEDLLVVHSYITAKKRLSIDRLVIC